ncbi:DASH complex subunit Duo1-domain-containing protein [Amylocystis lapponica]|nr:DASH complex subunit Duo1-domain-containing protein [Amylocystis lapponica]
MDSPNISDFALNSGSRLLSESSLLPGSSSNSSRTGHGGDDLSLSELSLQDRPHAGPIRRRPFSLLAPPPDEPSIADESAVAEDAEQDEEGVVDHTMTQEDVEKARKLATKTREEKLQHDLFILKKLNSAFEVYKEALRETKSSTERVATQLEHTNALLDKYVKILSQSENITRLIMDERWQGAEADEEVMSASTRRRFVRKKSVHWLNNASGSGWNAKNANGRNVRA